MGFSVAALGRRKLGANQVAPGRKGSFYGRVIVFYTLCLTLELFTTDLLLVSCINCLVRVKDFFSKDSVFRGITFHTNEGLLIDCESLQKRGCVMDKEKHCCLYCQTPCWGWNMLLCMQANVHQFYSEILFSFILTVSVLICPILLQCSDFQRSC